MGQILMPKATAVWLIDNTSLTFVQIADFCGLHHLEVKGIADGDVAGGVLGRDPIAGGQLDRDEITKGEADPDYRLKASGQSEIEEIRSKSRKGARYTPISKRQEKPNAIAWVLKFHPEITDPQIVKLLGTTKTTIQSVRDRSHWNASNIRATDPVSLGLCTQTELDAVVERARERARKRGELVDEDLSPGVEFPGAEPEAEAAFEVEDDYEDERRDEPTVDSVFRR